MAKIGVLIPCRDRKEYTEKCLRSIETAQTYQDVRFHLVDDGSNDNTIEILNSSTLPKIVTRYEESCGLRKVIINFFHHAKQYDYILKVDNDCLVPKLWLKSIIDVLSTSDVDILSPNVSPSNAAFTNGVYQEGLNYRPSRIVGGLWAMRSKLIEGIDFDGYGVSGIIGAFQILNQIIIEKDAKVGWLPDVTFQDIGHWSGEHPEHIKSDAHREYSAQIGRRIAW